MSESQPSKKKSSASGSPLMVRLDDESKSYLAQAAKLRRISMSDYVRSVLVAQAQREVEAAGRQTIALSPAEQIAFWKGLQSSRKPTPAQKRLGDLMRGDS